MSEQPVPFTLHVPDAAIADLRERLARTRFPDQAGEPWAYGSDVGYMRELVRYWQSTFDWRAAEAALNALPQYKLPLHGIDVHFLHVPGNGPDPCPLLLSHGWPGSVLELLAIIPRLTDPARFGGDPADAFTVVAPSLPGYGLSFKPGQQRFGVEAIADCFAELMTVLGYERFAAQGGDWGAFVTSRLGYAHAQRLIGIHLNLIPIPRDPAMVKGPTPDEARYLEELKAFLKEETGYQWIQGTRPQTLAFALTDSPVGLAAWIIEKFRAWSDCGGDLESVFSKDQLLANIGLYWLTGAIGASFWPYYARMHGPWHVPPGETVDVPAGFAAFPREILRPPRSLAARVYTDLRRWTAMPKGGHFAAMEQPGALADEIRAFFRPLRAP
ncbi:MAG: epoxide hydrolase family protein [Geminicoccaceae bacterium]